MKFLILGLLIFLTAACTTNNFDEAVNSINKEEIEKHVKLLSSDDFEGRAPDSKGEELTINYLKGEFERLGLKPANGNSYFQEINLVRIMSHASSKMIIEGRGKKIELNHADEFVAQSKHLTDEIEISDADLVFAGYGIVAPEYNWNDYADLDVKDKFVIVMVNDPGYHTKDSSLFTGNAMTYYGRWRYKYEEAARQGAAGIFVVHETGAAGYPWAVVRNGWTGEEFTLDSPDKNTNKSEIEGWFNLDKTREIFAAAGYNFDEELEKAKVRGYKGFNLGLKSSLIIKNDFSTSKSNNVLAVLEGSKHPDEYIFYMGHWDHMGIDTTLEGDQIYNGARDNAAGIASILEIAEAFSKLDKKPERSIVFFATAVEEQGLLGSAHYAANPIFPLNKTVAAINIDAPNVYGETSDITLIGYGQSELDNYVKRAAEMQNRNVHSDPTPEKGFYYRSDHFSFAKVGIPAIYLKSGNNHIHHGEDYIVNLLNDYTQNHYHEPSDEFYEDKWDLQGLVVDTQLLFKVGNELANNNDWPKWNEKSEFRAAREASLSK
ncbi:MAG: peptidase M28 [Ignavibacteriae bacterium]|nr:peptidase M28 [Ignavibacteriota bacterium]